jgi:hypothetical protein
MQVLASDVSTGRAQPMDIWSTSPGQGAEAGAVLWWNVQTGDVAWTHPGTVMLAAGQAVVLEGADGKLELRPHLLEAPAP